MPEPCSYRLSFHQINHQHSKSKVDLNATNQEVLLLLSACAVLSATRMFRSADRALSLISALPMLLYQTGRRKRRRRRGGGERSRTERGEERRGAGKYSSVARGPRSPSLRRRLFGSCCYGVCVRAFATCAVSAMAEATTNIELDSSISTDHYSVNQQVRLSGSNNVTVTIHCCTITRRFATMESIVALLLVMIYCSVGT